MADQQSDAIESPWQRVFAVVVLVVIIDLVLGLAAPAGSRAGSERGRVDESRGEARASLARLARASAEGQPAILLIGDSVLAGDVMAGRVPDWRSQRVVDHLRRELAIDSPVVVEQVARDGLLPVDAVHVLAALDRLDPAGAVDLVLELNLRQFSRAYADQRECARPELCDLASTGTGTGARAAGTAALDWLGARAPIHRRRPAVDRLELDAVEGLVRRREISDALAAEQAERRAEGLARVREHYRSSTIDSDHAQIEALVELFDRLAARGRSASLFLTPLEDGFASDSLPRNALPRRYEQLARLINDHPAGAALLDLDHPLFEADAFLDHVHLRPEGNRLLALNLLHELGLPLARRPQPWMMIHDEDHDRTLIHRRGHGFADGGAWSALTYNPDGVDVSRDGARVVIADTGNHMLRQLRGNMQLLERLAGEPTKAGDRDGAALGEARLRAPRSPRIVGDRIYFVDGARSERVRVLDGDRVTTASFAGPSCERVDVLEAGEHAGRSWLYLLCHDDRILAVDLEAGRTTKISDPRAPILRDPATGATRRYTTIEPTDDGRLLFADGRANIWALRLRADGTSAAPKIVFENTRANDNWMPSEFKDTYPFDFDEVGFEAIVDMEWVERYGGLLIQDQRALGRDDARLQIEETERVHLRFLDLRQKIVLPWMKAIPHTEAFHMWNARTRNYVSYFHIGTMALAQDDASLFWVERGRSRVLRLADGLLGVHKTGNLHTTHGIVHMVNPVGTQTSKWVGEHLRPDRHLDARHEPIPHRGPFTALLVGSSLSTVSDRLGNYSIGRRLELELQAELGYRDNIRLDLFQRTASAVRFGYAIGMVETFLTEEGPPPDVIFIEINDFHHDYLARHEKRAKQLERLAELEALAARYGSLVIFYDVNGVNASGSDGLRATSRAIRDMIDDARKLGFVVLTPTDALLRELLRESPWSNQTWKRGQHHGSPWAVELSARALAAMSAPVIREFLREREPARRSERDPASFAQDRDEAKLDGAFARVDTRGLREVASDHVRTSYASGEVRIFVDLSGFETREPLDALALAVLHRVLVEEVYGALAHEVTIELVEFSNYDEYGEGVRESATLVWGRTFDATSLQEFVRATATMKTGGERR